MIGRVVLIDNGHGVETPGKRSPDGMFREFSWAREMADMVVSALNDIGITAFLLVKERNDVSLSERVNRVNAYCRRYGTANVILVSIHNNAAGNGKDWMSARGWECWTSVGQTKADKLASIFYDKARFYLPRGTKIRTDKTDGDDDKESNFYILKNTMCPAVLTENFFQDNKEDVAILKSTEGKQAICRVHVEAIKAYLKTL